MDAVLQYAIENGMINLDSIQEQMKIKEREELLNKHPYSIWQGRNDNWYTYLPDDNNGRKLIKRAKRTSIEDVICDYWREEDEAVTIQEVFNDWNDYRYQIQQITPGTYERNKVIFKRHFITNSNFSNKNIKTLTPEDVIEFLERQVFTLNLPSKAFSNLKCVVRGILKRAKRKKLINFSISDVFEDLEISNRDMKYIHKEDKDEVFTDDEMDLLLPYLHEHPTVQNLGVLLLFYTGLRCGELTALKWSDINKNTITVQRTETLYITEDGKVIRTVKDKPKTQAGIRTIVVPSEGMAVLHQLRLINPFTEYVFTVNNKRIDTYYIRRALTNACKAVNVKRRTPHKVRKTYGSILLDNSLDSRFIISQMGHTDITCTEKFYHKDRKNIDEKTAIINGIKEFKIG